MWALTDFTVDNGATHIAPGTSAMSDDDAAEVDTIAAEMRRGSLLFYDGKVLHGGGANVSDGVRRGVNITYAVGWVRQEENQYLACPPDIGPNPRRRSAQDDGLPGGRVRTGVRRRPAGPARGAPRGTTKQADRR